MSNGLTTSPNIRHRQIIDTLVDNWEKNRYPVPGHSSAESKIIFNKFKHIG